MIANLVCSKMLHLQVTCEIQNKRQEGYCAYVDHMRVFEFHGCAKKQAAVSHAGLHMDGLPALHFGECVLETLSSKPAEGNLESHKRDKSHSVSFIF